MSESGMCLPWDFDLGPPPDVPARVYDSDVWSSCGWSPIGFRKTGLHRWHFEFLCDEVDPGTDDAVVTFSASAVIWLEDGPDDGDAHLRISGTIDSDGLALGEPEVVAECQE